MGPGLLSKRECDGAVTMISTVTKELGAVEPLKSSGACQDTSMCVCVKNETGALE